ncbi:hypothetical protein RvY_10404-2 [Ramazzottius varieornatus]|uniref:Adenosine 5'-monophosphoramidase HINT3 n=1 Tax=Ramazzottius varieornatus TaxID=947166 RepID=A0A1D1VEQ7_RAMVA|nr:hypothetical protein RvY_10404-2 [Ramazzottius varieornatus]
MSSSNGSCLFCKISDGKDDKTVLLRDDDGIVVFRDIHPATTHHYLVVPKRHVRNVNELVPDDAELMERLVAAGKQVLGEQGVKDYDDVRYGNDPPCKSM